MNFGNRNSILSEVDQKIAAATLDAAGFIEGDLPGAIAGTDGQFSDQATALQLQRLQAFKDAAARSLQNAKWVGMADMQSADSIECADGLNSGYSSLTFLWEVLAMPDWTPSGSSGILSSSNSGINRLTLFISTAGNVSFEFADDLNVKTYPFISLPNPLTNGDRYRLAITIDMATELISLYTYNLDNSDPDTDGFNGSVTALGISGIEFGKDNPNKMTIANDTDTILLATPVKIYNDAMTAQEVEDHYLHDRLPERLRGDGSFDTVIISEDNSEFTGSSTNWVSTGSATATLDTVDDELDIVANASSGGALLTSAYVNDFGPGRTYLLKITTTAIDLDGAAAFQVVTFGGVTDYILDITTTGELSIVFETLTNVSTPYFALRLSGAPSSSASLSVSSFNCYPLGETQRVRSYNNIVQAYSDAGNHQNFVGNPRIVPGEAKPKRIELQYVKEWAGTSDPVSLFTLPAGYHFAGGNVEVDAAIGFNLGDGTDVDRFVDNQTIGAGERKALVFALQNADGTNYDIEAKPEAAFSGTAKINLVIEKD